MRALLIMRVLISKLATICVLVIAARNVSSAQTSSKTLVFTPAFDIFITNAPGNSNRTFDTNQLKWGISGVYPNRYEYQTIIKYNFSALTSLPNNAIIESAKLEIGISAGPVWAAGVYPIDVNVTSTSTWNSLGSGLSGSELQTAVGAFGNQSTNSTIMITDVNLANYIRNIAWDNLVHKGFAIIGTPGTGFTEFASSGPKLTVTYKLPSNPTPTPTWTPTPTVPGPTPTPIQPTPTFTPTPIIPKVNISMNEPRAREGVFANIHTIFGGVAYGNNSTVVFSFDPVGSDSATAGVDYNLNGAVYRFAVNLNATPRVYSQSYSLVQDPANPGKYPITINTSQYSAIEIRVPLLTQTVVEGIEHFSVKAEANPTQVNPPTTLTTLVSIVDKGDYVAGPDSDGLVNYADIDRFRTEYLSLLTPPGATPTPPTANQLSLYDLNNDNSIDQQDFSILLGDYANLLPGDADGNCTVSGADFATWQANNFGSLKSWKNGNFNLDNFIDGSDFNLWNQNKYSTTCANPLPIHPEGDLNGDLRMNAADIDVLVSNFSAGYNPKYDLNGDQLVNTNDLHTFVVEMFETIFGDANLDCIVDQKDFDIINAHYGRSGTGWAQGNFNTDGVTNFTDYVTANNNYLSTGSCY